MPATWLALRRRLLTPSPRQTDLAERGFRVKDPAARAALEGAGRGFVTGFGHAAGSATPADAERLLEAVDRPFRGFAYEGAAMAYSLMAGLGLGDHVGPFLAGRAQRHVYMAYVGAGWAMARLPRWRWRRIFPTDPLLRWLALDGYGFHQAYFHTRRYVHRQQRPAPAAWPLPELAAYADQVVDQGIGRALWFVGGADVRHVVELVGRFAPERRGDLFSGVGLAATYAGGVDPEELDALWRLAGDHRPAVAQGSAFAAKARLRAGLATEHTARATAALCAATPEEAARMTDDALRDLPGDGALPGYAVWRRRIADEFARLAKS
ncbi:DUF1702 family protein [Micromonospora olivasterospora]|uniref:Uncharacterized protein DUF1702 n=1 Tax=Micromonospora olivasterospora TaxID=1880 RepID=A0A562I3E8_MICOL|nr:DUF1702 family protein [Micromonospora olivasterospora]TWH65143.1 uncharacterized protein DUF1702 [Micromonospora olivasterospora]